MGTALSAPSALPRESTASRAQELHRLRSEISRMQRRRSDVPLLPIDPALEGLLPDDGLPVAEWDNPYTDRPVCSKPFQTIVSDNNPSYDGDLPGNAFGLTAPSDTLGDLNVATLGQTIWNGEFTGAQNIFIGQSGASIDGAPTPQPRTRSPSLTPGSTPTAVPTGISSRSRRTTIQ